MAVELPRASLPVRDDPSCLRPCLRPGARPLSMTLPHEPASGLREWSSIQATSRLERSTGSIATGFQAFEDPLSYANLSRFSSRMQDYHRSLTRQGYSRDTTRTRSPADGVALIGSPMGELAHGSCAFLPRRCRCIGERSQPEQRHRRPSRRREGRRRRCSERMPDAAVVAEGSPPVDQAPAFASVLKISDEGSLSRSQPLTPSMILFRQSDAG